MFTAIEAKEKTAEYAAMRQEKIVADAQKFAEVIGEDIKSKSTQGLSFHNASLPYSSEVTTELLRLLKEAGYEAEITRIYHSRPAILIKW